MGWVLQDFPEVPKQREWKASRKPEPVDWTALIKDAQEKGKAVPEMHWVESGEDAAMEVRLNLPARCCCA